MDAYYILSKASKKSAAQGEQTWQPPSPPTSSPSYPTHVPKSKSVGAGWWCFRSWCIKIFTRSRCTFRELAAKPKNPVSIYCRKALWFKHMVLQWKKRKPVVHTWIINIKSLTSHWQSKLFSVQINLLVIFPLNWLILCENWLKTAKKKKKVHV